MPALNSTFPETHRTSGSLLFYPRRLKYLEALHTKTQCAQDGNEVVIVYCDLSSERPVMGFSAIRKLYNSRKLAAWKPAALS